MSEMDPRETGMRMPPNSKQSKKVIKGSVKKTDGGVGKKIITSFIKSDAKTLGDYVMFDVIIPTLKNAALSAVELLFYGESRRGVSNTVRKVNNTPYTSYDAYYNGSKAATVRPRHEFDNYTFDTRADAETVLDLLIDNLREYNAVSIATFYDFVGVTTQHTDFKYGWTNLSKATVVGVRDGYIIDLPRPQLLD